MTELFNISHPFLTVEDFERRAGSRLARLIHRLVGKYPTLPERSGRERMLMALSVAWEMTTAAREGRRELLRSIDEALTPYQCLGYVLEPPGGCVAVDHRPFVIADDDEPGIRSFLWDGFTIFIENEGIDHINQDFFDLAEKHQLKAYIVMSEEGKLEDTNIDNRKTETSVKKTNIRQVSNIIHNNNTAADCIRILGKFMERLDLLEECMGNVVEQLAKMEKKMEINQTFNYYAPIGQQIAHVDKIEAHFDKNMGMTVEGKSIAQSACEGEASTEDEESMPRELTTAKAQAVLEALREIGMLDADFQPIGLSWAESGYLARQISYKLGIDHQWVVFSKLWHCDGNSLRSGYNRAKDMAKMAMFDEKIKGIIS